MSVARNTLYNLLGGLFPMLVALVTVPLYLKFIGAAEYGILTIAWLLMGYSTYAELGVGQGIANEIARLGDRKIAEHNTVFWTGFVAALIFGVIVGFAMMLFGYALIPYWTSLGTKLKVELLHALPLLVAAGPLVTGNSVLASTIESRHHFIHVNIIQSTGLALAQGLPLLIVFFGHQTIFWLLGFAVLGRAIMFLALLLALAELLPLRGGVNFDSSKLRFLFSFGGWVTISNVAETLLSSLDRWFAGVFLGAQAVAYYTVPANLATRTAVFPVAIVRTLFPRLSAMDPQTALQETSRITVYLARFLAPLIGFGIIIINPFLKLWVGSAFAKHAVMVAPILLLAAWVRSIYEIPDVLLRAMRRPRVVATIRVLELPLLFAMCWFGFKWLGLPGLAWAWCLRVMLDAIYLLNKTGCLSQVARCLWPQAVGIAVIYLVMNNDYRPLSSGAFVGSGCALAFLIGCTVWVDRKLWMQIWQALHVKWDSKTEK